jgi:hypothetical protein
MNEDSEMEILRKQRNKEILLLAVIGIPLLLCCTASVLLRDFIDALLKSFLP